MYRLIAFDQDFKIVIMSNKAHIDMSANDSFFGNICTDITNLIKRAWPRNQAN